MPESTQSFARIAQPAQTIVLCDIDGVLAPIVDDPAAAAIPADTLDLLAQAHAQCARVACVTGRSLEDAQRLMSVPGVMLAACHGMQWVDEHGVEHTDPVAVAARPQLDLALRLAQTVGWRFEDKGCSVTLHFRHVASPELTAQQMRAQISTVLDPRVVELADARMALEIRPKGARTKRDAVLDVLQNAPATATTAVYLGDDRTDLDAFIALGESGLQILRVAVDSEEAPAGLIEAADHVLSSQEHVRQFLSDLIAEGPLG